MIEFAAKGLLLRGGME